MQQNHTLLAAAREYLRRGWSVIPIGKAKRPALPTWIPYQSQHPTDAEIVKWFSRKSVQGVALICGPVSAGLTVRDFDDEAAHHLVEQLDLIIAVAAPS